jgi:hypothetical protein
LGRKSALPDTAISICFNCGYDLTQATAVPACKSLCDLQAEWYRIMEEGWRPDVLFPHLYFEVLHQVVKMLSSCNQRCAVLQKEIQAHTNLALPSYTSAARNGKIVFEQLNLAERNILLRQAAWVLADWPNRFIEVMKQCRVTSTPLLRDMATVPFWYHTVVHEHFYISNVNRHFSVRY